MFTMLKKQGVFKPVVPHHHSIFIDGLGNSFCIIVKRASAGCKQILNMQMAVCDWMFPMLWRALAQQVLFKMGLVLQNLI